MGACPGLIVGLLGAGLYAMGGEATDRGADFVAVTMPICLMTITLGRSLLSREAAGVSARALLSALGAGVMLVLMVVAGRLSLLDAQLLLAAGAVLVLIADSGRTDEMRSVRPVIGVMGAALIGGLLWWLVWMDAGVWTVWLGIGGFAVMLAFRWRIGEGGVIAARASMVVTSIVVALTGGSLGALGMTIARNIGEVRPVGMMATLEVMALSVGTAPALIGLARLAPEAALLIAGPVVVLSSPASGLRKAIAWILVAGAVFLLGERFLGLLGVGGVGGAWGAGGMVF